MHFFNCVPWWVQPKNIPLHLLPWMSNTRLRLNLLTLHYCHCIILYNISCINIIIILFQVSVDSTIPTMQHRTTSECSSKYFFCSSFQHKRVVSIMFCSLFFKRYKSLYTCFQTIITQTALYYKSTPLNLPLTANHYSDKISCVPTERNRSR